MHRSVKRSNAIDASPPAHREMRDRLDKTVFRKTIPVLAARVPASKTGVILREDAMKRSFVDLPKIKSVIPDPANTDGRLLLLRVSDESDLPQEAREFLKAVASGYVTHNLELDYDYWTADEILQAILPEDLLDGSPTGFACTGHLAHMNLNDEYLPFKHIIGQVILDKNKAIRTVVNKIETIGNKFRVFKMEVIAGEPDYIVEHHESGCKFTFDFSQVYWNSRLGFEHDRIVQLFKPEDVVADVFAGVGPFAIPAAKKGCAIFANDLNPSSYEYLAKNIEDNRVGVTCRASCEDGRDFIRAVVVRALENPFPAYTGPKISKRQIKEQRKASSSRPATPTYELPPRQAISQFVMNLPDSAIEFLDAFRGILSSASVPEGRDLAVVYKSMPMIHCHCFTRELEFEKAEADIRQRVEEKLGCSLTDADEVSLHHVRSVAPNKDMYCISFRLPQQVAYS
ncbi:hypothetical protein JAAARDRAFT_53342 [Jaapia argillacea MUCL 33604]|uniref:tRNA (guanine(37)-N1)-methyltransferase n=1 Tax=Jaapia argillacea MUCL 33604 TaxID=933084 RepID=A0A067Q819_9AGAM|nr:hypothetical protein JAAARDRAFT_53342 [Jaapia argillacea MUCL 33604]